ncbi:MAG: DUF58 domain-containing protein [Muribaculaceae bacterium]|nr:DUF58 domain-containing protein [Roseburia sp.]MCM1432005.1 DUF58 domain-containing protein [Muribaculaceae bacterium]MCM1493741.1 DUF58 domain-containing protein [Muribaculaceae bacterium]
MASFLIGIVVMVFTFYLALIYSSVAIGLLGFAEAVLLALAFLYLYSVGSRVRAAIHVPLASVERGGEAVMRLEVENKRRLPLMKVRYRIRYSSSFFSGRKRRWYSGGVIPSGTHSYRAAVRLAAAGNYTVVLERIRVYDLTGIFYRNLRMKKSAGILVLPEVTDVSLRITENLRSFFGDSDVYDDFRPGNDRSEIFDIREFREGDKIQSIHWKLSAKSEELVVREDSQPLACPVVVLLEDYGLAGRDAEAFLSAMASLVFSLMDNACPHYLSWYSESRQDMVRIRVDDEEGYYMAVCAYMGDCSLQTQTDALARYNEKYRYDRPMHVLEMRADLSLWQDGGKRAEVDSGDWKASLEQLELVL